MHWYNVAMDFLKEYIKNEEKKLHSEFDLLADKAYELLEKTKGKNPIRVYLSQQTIGSVNTPSEKDSIPHLCEDLLNLDKELSLKLSSFIEKSFLFSSNYPSIEIGLNSKESIDKTGIIILPKIKAIWSGKSVKEHHCDNDFDIGNFTYCQINDSPLLKKYKLNCIFLGLPEISSKLFDNDGKKTINFAGTPLSNLYTPKYFIQDVDEDGTKLSKIFFDNSYDSQTEEKIENLILQTIYDSNLNKDDILVFPEAMLSRKIIESVIEKIRSRPQKYLKIIVLPTIWEKMDGKDYGKNFSIIIDGQGREICKQEKLISYIHEEDDKSIPEAILPDNQINLMYLNDFGCISVLICRTFLETAFRLFCNSELCTTLLLCPAYSTGVHEFMQGIEANKEFAVNTIWCNSCSIGNSNEKVVISKYIRGDRNENNNFIFYSTDCNKICHNQNCSCIARTPLTVQK
ncbi:hypothetical protein J5751_04060 [bacterium]|nr:hypothetical protein [bacterium]